METEKFKKMEDQAAFMQELDIQGCVHPEKMDVYGSGCTPLYLSLLPSGEVNREDENVYDEYGNVVDLEEDESE